MIAVKELYQLKELQLFFIDTVGILQTDILFLLKMRY